MSSREIVDLVEARHNDVVTTIERLFAKGLLRSSRKTRREATGGRPIEVYDLIERDTHLVVAGYSGTMSSQEIADLVGSRHDNVKTAIDRLAAKGVISQPSLQDELDGEYYETFVVKNQRGPASEGLMLTKDQCLLVSMRESRAVQLLYKDAFRVSGRHYGADDFPAIRKSYCIEVGRVKSAEKAHSGVFAQLAESRICAFLGYDVLTISRLDNIAHQDEHALGERSPMSASHHVSANRNPVGVSSSENLGRLRF